MCLQKYQVPCCVTAARAPPSTGGENPPRSLQEYYYNILYCIISLLLLLLLESTLSHKVFPRSQRVSVTLRQIHIQSSVSSGQGDSQHRHERTQLMISGLSEWQPFIYSLWRAFLYGGISSISDENVATELFPLELRTCWDMALLSFRIIPFYLSKNVNPNPHILII